MARSISQDPISQDSFCGDSHTRLRTGSHGLEARETSDGRIKNFEPEAFEHDSAESSSASRHLVEQDLEQDARDGHSWRTAVRHAACLALIFTASFCGPSARASNTTAPTAIPAPASQIAERLSVIAQLRIDRIPQPVVGLLAVRPAPQDLGFSFGNAATEQAEAATPKTPVAADTGNTVSAAGTVGTANTTGLNPAASATAPARKGDVHPVSARYGDLTRMGDRGVGGGMNFYSIEKEIALGKGLSSEVEQNARILEDPVITEYVNRLGQRIVRNSDAKVPFTIKVVDNDEVNAFALPGGFFYVNTGLIMEAENEAELAGVMAHEIAHVAARHATKNATKSELWNFASIPLIFVGGPIGMAVRQVANIAVPMTFLKFSRDAEREADLLGLEYQYASGYDPAAFVSFFEKAEAMEKSGKGTKDKKNLLAKAFSTHPMNADRIKRAQNLIASTLPARDQYVVSTSEFDEMKARLVALSNRHKIDAGANARPTLRNRGGTGATSPATGGTTTASASGADPAPSGSADDRPTLKRR